MCISDGDYCDNDSATVDEVIQHIPVNTSGRGESAVHVQSQVMCILEFYRNTNLFNSSISIILEADANSQWLNC